MISASSLTPSASMKGHQHGHALPLSLVENGRHRLGDSQKFLVPSLPPVSARGLAHPPPQSGQGGEPNKRRERSIVNGTVGNSQDYTSHPHHLSHNPYPNSQHHNGVVRPYQNHQQQQLQKQHSRESRSPGRSSKSPQHPHKPYLHSIPSSHSPRKDAQSPMYSGEGGGGVYASRSSMPTPCSSPAQASSASPKRNHTHSPGIPMTVGIGGSYSPKLPSGPPLAPAELGSLGRLYPGFPPPPHPSVAAHLSPFYAAAAAAAANAAANASAASNSQHHHIPYPIFGHFNPSSHSAAAASAYLDTFHNTLMNRGDNRSPSPPSTSRAYQQMMHHHHQHQSTNNTLTTSLHNKLIESTSCAADRHAHYHQVVASSSPGLGISKGGPLGIAGGIMNLASSRAQGPSSPHNHQGELAKMNDYHHKMWMEHHKLHYQGHQQPQHQAQDMTISNHTHKSSISFEQQGSYQSGRFPHPYSHTNGGGGTLSQQQQAPGGGGVLTDSNHAKKQPSHFLLPPEGSPKKRGSVPWNFAVPANPPPTNNKMEQLLPPLESSSTKYLSSKPASSSIPSYHGQSSQQSSSSHIPSSPRKGGSGPPTPKSPSVHQVKFSFSSGSSKENLYKNGSGGGAPVTGKRNDSSSSSSSNEGSNNIAWPVEQMPIIDAFRRGSLIKLASGSLRPVEDLKAEDFIQCAANGGGGDGGSFKIIHCTVLSIQKKGEGAAPCKVTMTLGSQLQNQQVIVPSTPEQPFFVLGRGWSSLSPKTTERLLQLPCYPLAVGDVCITLSKSFETTTASPKSCAMAKSPAAPCTRGRKTGGGGGGKANNASQGKRSAPQSNSQKLGIKSGKGLFQESIKSPNMGPPLSSGVILGSLQLASFTNTAATEDLDSTSQSTAAKCSDVQNGLELLGPPSPKKRRWSAPESDLLQTTVQQSTLLDNSQENVPVKENESTMDENSNVQSLKPVTTTTIGGGILQKNSSKSLAYNSKEISNCTF